MGVRRVMFRSIHAQLGGSFRLFLSAGAYLPPAVQRPGRTSGSRSSRAMAGRRRGPAAAPRSTTTVSGRSAGRRRGWQVKLAEDGEILFKGPTLFHGYWNDPVNTAEAFTPNGWYRSGDIGHFDDHGRLVRRAASKDIIVLPNGFNVYPEDIENALRIAGVRDAVVVETQPGRIEAVVLASAVSAGLPRAEAVATATTRQSSRATSSRGQGRQRHARGKPADRRVAAVARRGLPAHPYPEDQACGDPGVGRGRCTAAGSVGGRARSSSRVVAAGRAPIAGAHRDRWFVTKARQPSDSAAISLTIDA